MPGTITEEKFKKLVKSLLVFPRMLSLRPIVVDSQMNVLGGNMRLRALKHIVTMDKDTLRFTIANDETSKFTKGKQGSDCVRKERMLRYRRGTRI